MADILWENVVGKGTLKDGGYVGDLMHIMRAHIDDAVRANRLKQADAGEAYASLIPTAVNGAIKFTMEEQLVEAQIVKAEADAEMAQITADREYVLTIANIDKVYGYDYTLDSEGKIIRTSLVNAGDGKMDYETELVKEQTESEAMQNEVDGVINKEKAKIDQEIQASKDTIKLGKMPSTLAKG